MNEVGCGISDLGRFAFELYVGAMFVLLALAAIGAALNARMRAHRPPGGYAPAPTKRPYRMRHQGTGWPPFYPSHTDATTHAKDPIPRQR